MIKLLFWTLALGAGALTFGFAMLLENEPRLGALPPPSPGDVATTRQLVHDIRASINTGEPLRTDTTQLNSAVRLSSRLTDGFRGEIIASAGEIRGQITLPIPWPGRQKWLNLTGRLPTFEGRVALSDVTVGPVALPPELTLKMGQIGANLVFGNRFGDKILNAVTAMTVYEDEIVFRLALDEMGRNGLMRSAFGTMRGADMPDADEIETYHRRIRAAISSGRLANSGSFLSYIRFTLEAVYAESTPETLPDVYTAAIFGLAKACGAGDFAMIVGRLAFDVTDFRTDWPANCDTVTLNGRIDSRRHFITAAALQAASNRGFSVSVGEFKELYDMISGAGGFDFTDMAANLSGIRLSNVMMAVPRAEWTTILDVLETENDLIVPFEGIPGLMPEAEFKARFRDVQNPAYIAMIDWIEARIDTLRVYRDRPAYSPVISD